MAKIYSSKWLFLLVLNLRLATTVFAQCPVPAGCAPGNASNQQAPAFGMGIFNVTIGSINNSTAGTADGYQDYSCTVATPLTKGQSYPVSIQTNANVNESVRVWIDYNNDGQFHATNELFFSSDNARQHTGASRVIPTTAVAGVRLRMRVAADAAVAPVPTACSTPQYSQTEDYGVTLQAATRPPVPAFAATPGTACGTYAFQDQSTGAATNWRWTFGDGTTSLQQNPTHTYTTPGTYAVRLRTCNAFGCDSLQQAAAVTVFAAYPAPATCRPATLNYCCNYGVTRFDFGTLTSSSAPGSAGYEDFSCSRRTTVAQGQAVPLQIITSATAQDTWVYLDANNDGAFAVSELLFQAPNRVNPQGFVVIPRTTQLNQPLRLRIISDAVGSAAGPCADRTSGQAEDYAVVVTPTPCPVTVQGGQVAYFHSAAQNLNIGADSVAIALLLTRYSPGATIQWQRSPVAATPTWQPVPGATGPTLFYKRLRPEPDSLYRVVVTCGTATATSANTVQTTVGARPRLHTNGCSGTSNLFIQRVRLGGTLLNTPSACSNTLGTGYRLFNPAQPTSTATVLRGETYELEVTTTQSSRISVYVGTQTQDLLPPQWVQASAAGTPTRFLLKLDSLLLPSSTTVLHLRVRCDTDTRWSNPVDRDRELLNGDTEDYLLRVVPLTCAEPVTAGTLAGPAAAACPRDSFELSVSGYTPGARLQWQRSTDSLTWQPIAGASGRFFKTRINTTSYYRLQAQGCTSTAASPVVKVVARPIAECYCAAPVAAVPSTAPTITRVKILGTTLDNTSASTGGGPGATTYAPTSPARTAELVRGATYTLQLAVANAGAPSSAKLQAAAWLDLNRNGQYDSLEWVHLLRTPASTATTYQATLPVGVWATPGTMGLRLQVGNDAAFRPSRPCAAVAGQGETETYTVTVVAPPCGGTLTAGTIDYQANVSGICRSRVRSTSYTPGADLQWQMSNGGVTWADIPGAIGDEYVIWSAASEFYRLRVQCGGFTAYSPSVRVNNLSTTSPCGCAVNGPQGLTAQHAYVDDVEIVGTPLVNLGSGISYLPSPSLVSPETTGQWAPQTQGFTATLLRGSSYGLRLVAVGSVSSATPAGAAVGAWIDWNHNGTFDGNEYYGSPTTGVGRVTYTGTIAVPATAMPGLTLMRVRAAGSLPSTQGCQYTSESETEEYFVTVADQVPLAVPVLTATPLPLCLGSTLQLGVIGAGTGVRYDWLGPAGFTATNTAAPTRAGITAPHGGTYIAVVTRNGERLLTSVYVPVDTCRAVLAVRGQARNSPVAVYPNPTTGQCQVSLPASMAPPAHVQVRNTTGQLVSIPTPTLHIGADATEVFLDLSGLPQGLYLLEISTAHGRIYGKVVRQ
jgi:PKD repeat protein